MLFFDGMGKKEISLIRNEEVDGHLFDPQQHIAVVHILGHGKSFEFKLLILEGANRGALYGQLNGKLLEDRSALVGNQRHPGIRRDLAFFDDADFHKDE